jgi:hypothetical protein
MILVGYKLIKLELIFFKNYLAATLCLIIQRLKYQVLQKANQRPYFF